MMNEFGHTVSIKSGDIEITTAPELGFSLVSFRYRGLEILDTRLKEDFLAIRKGLGPLIVPHFNQQAAVPQGVDKQAFPHVAALEARGVRHPFQHGIGRYVSWEHTVDGNTVRGRIDGAMSWRGHSLADLTGYNFSAQVVYSVEEDGLKIAFDVSGDRPVAAGIHFYYNLFEKSVAGVRLPAGCEAGEADLRLSEPIDKGFPVKHLPARTEAACTLVTDSYSLVTRFPTGGDPETSFDTVVIFCPAGGGFACIEPVSYRLGSENTKKRFRGAIRLQPAPPPAGD